MKLTAQQSGIVVCALATAVIHLAAAFDQKLFPGHVDPLFLLNGLGYLGLLGAYFLPIPLVQARHKLAWWALFVFTIVTILAWVVIWVGFYVIRDGHNFFAYDSIYGLPAKIVELLLLGLLWAEKPR